MVYMVYMVTIYHISRLERSSTLGLRFVHWIAPQWPTGWKCWSTGSLFFFVLTVCLSWKKEHPSILVLIGIKKTVYHVTHHINPSMPLVLNADPGPICCWTPGNFANPPVATEDSAPNSLCSTVNRTNQVKRPKMVAVLLREMGQNLPSGKLT